VSDSELRATLGAARAWIGEWLEEGVETFTRTAPPQPEAAAPRRGAPRREAAAPARASSGESLEAIQERLGDCQRCALSEGRKSIVFGDGNPNADILFIGEGPGAEEDKRGVPFVGRAGELLTRMIERGMGIPRADVYICNIVKCRPPGNRDPEPEETAACRPFLDAQIDSVAPRVIVTLGRPAASVLLGREVAITRLRGNWQEYRGIPVMPTFHPAYVLRQYTEQNRRMVWQDLKAALEAAER
jgi:DNA polymerase